MLDLVSRRIGMLKQRTVNPRIEAPMHLLVPAHITAIRV